jgi:hypothetical protein
VVSPLPCDDAFALGELLFSNAGLPAENNCSFYLRVCVSGVKGLMGAPLDDIMASSHGQSVVCVLQLIISFA